MKDERWYQLKVDRLGRKGQLCRIVMRGPNNACLVEFEDGVRERITFPCLKPAAAPREGEPARASNLQERACAHAHDACALLAQDEALRTLTARIWPHLRDAFLKGGEAGKREGREHALTVARTHGQKIVSPVLNTLVSVVRLSDLEAELGGSL